MEYVVRAVSYLVPMILCLSVHEWAHAWSAHKLGDDTALRMGRMTINPLAHIDWFGTVLIPLIGIFTGIPFFGWAKPVPVNPMNFKGRWYGKKGMLLTAAAGPLSNLAFALVSAGIISLLVHLHTGSWAQPVAQLFVAAMAVNVGLFAFNLLPVPPLDGSRVLYGLLPRRFEGVMDFIGKWSLPLFILIMVFGGRIILPVMRLVLSGIGFLVGVPEIGNLV
jgi:Zn-dependent protease